MSETHAMTTVTVLQRRQRLDQVGQRLPDSLHDTDQTITAGLVSRLTRYALTRLQESGFEPPAHASEVYTMDADLPPPERFYCVEFINAKGGRIGVQGILTERGWPTLDHGLCIGEANV